MPPFGLYVIQFVCRLRARFVYFFWAAVTLCTSTHYQYNRPRPTSKGTTCKLNYCPNSMTHPRRMYTCSLTERMEGRNWFGSLKNIHFIHGYVCEAMTSTRPTCIRLKSRYMYNISMLDSNHFNYPWHVATVLCTKFARKVVPTCMCMFDRHQFHYNVLQ